MNSSRCEESLLIILSFPECDGKSIYRHWRTNPFQKVLKIVNGKISDLTPLAGISAESVFLQCDGCDEGPISKINSKDISLHKDPRKFTYQLNFVKEMPQLAKLRVFGPANLQPLVGSSVNHFQFESHQDNLKHFIPEKSNPRYFLYPLLKCDQLEKISAPEVIKREFNFLTPNLAMALVQKNRTAATQEIENLRIATANHQAFEFASPFIDRLTLQIDAFFEKGDDFHVSAKKQFGNHTYQWVGIGMDWPSAKKFAEDAGGHLLTLNSREEGDWIAEEFFVKGSSRFITWLGGTDQKEEGNWEWVTGEPWTVGNRRWAFFQGRSPGGMSDYLQLEILKTPIKDTHCYLRAVQKNMPNALIIEWDAKPPKQGE